MTDTARASQHSEPTAPPRNGFGITALVLAIVGLVFGLVPLTGFIALILGALAVLFGLLGFSRSRKGLATNTRMSLTSTVLGALAAILGIWGIVIVFQATAHLAEDLDKLAEEPLNDIDIASPEGLVPDGNAASAGTVRYVVEGTGEAMSINYGTGTAGGYQSESLANTPIPWSTKVPVNTAGFNTYSLTASNGADGGTITCKILINGQVVQEATSSGPYQTAMCMK